MIWKGRVRLLCYSTTFLLLRASRGRTLRPYAYSANSKVAENYYTQRKKMRDRGKLNPRPRLWYHTRRPLLCQSNHKTQVIWKGRGSLLCYRGCLDSLLGRVLAWKRETPAKRFAFPPRPQNAASICTDFLNWNTRSEQRAGNHDFLKS
jgi:hypothetical protein